MRIHGLMLVKDEADIVGATLEAAARWCDSIYVFDNGSSDGTWELIQAIAARDPRVVPYKQDAKPFRQSLRGEIFRQFRDRAHPGDWWCILDGDEFYACDVEGARAAFRGDFGATSLAAGLVAAALLAAGSLWLATRTFARESA